MEFKTATGTPVHDVRQYILDIKATHPDVTIHIGTDSQRKKKRWVNYATVIAIRYGARGVHYIYSFKREKVLARMGKEAFIKFRLMHEIELTVTLALWFQELAVDVKIDVLEADVNSDDAWLSNKVYEAAKGWLKGVAPVGTTVLTKPDLLVAVRAANHLV